MHVRTCKGEHVHRDGIDESIQAIQSAFSAEYLVASGAGETPAHGGRMAQEGMGLAMSCKKNRPSRIGDARVWGFGGAKNAQNFPLPPSITYAGPRRRRPEGRRRPRGHESGNCSTGSMENPTASRAQGRMFRVLLAPGDHLTKWAVPGTRVKTETSSKLGGHQ